MHKSHMKVKKGFDNAPTFCHAMTHEKNEKQHPNVKSDKIVKLHYPVFSIHKNNLS